MKPPSKDWPPPAPIVSLIAGSRQADDKVESGRSGPAGEGDGDAVAARLGDGLDGAEGLKDTTPAVLEDEHALSATSATIASRRFTTVSTWRRHAGYWWLRKARLQVLGLAGQEACGCQLD